MAFRVDEIDAHTHKHWCMFELMEHRHKMWLRWTSAGCCHHEEGWWDMSWQRHFDKLKHEQNMWCASFPGMHISLETSLQYRKDNFQIHVSFIQPNDIHSEYLHTVKTETISWQSIISEAVAAKTTPLKSVALFLRRGCMSYQVSHVQLSNLRTSKLRYILLHMTECRTRHVGPSTLLATPSVPANSQFSPERFPTWEIHCFKRLPLQGQDTV